MKLSVCKVEEPRKQSVPESSVSQKEKNKYGKQIYVELETWYRGTYLQSRPGGIERIYLWTSRLKGRWEELGDLDWHMYTAESMSKIDN